jgi:hypothetical protein
MRCLYLTLSCTVFILFPNVHDKVLPENLYTHSRYDMPLFNPSCTVFILFPNVHDKVKYALPENLYTHSRYDMPLFNPFLHSVYIISKCL